MLVQGPSRCTWADVVQMLYKCFVFAGSVHQVFQFLGDLKCGLSSLVGLLRDDLMCVSRGPGSWPRAQVQSNS